MKQDIPFTDDELRRLAARVKAGQESPDVIDLLSEAEYGRLDALTAQPPMMASHAQAPAPMAAPGRPDSLVRGLAEGAGIPTSLGEAGGLAKMILTGPFGMNTLAKGIVDAGADQFRKGSEARAQGREGEGWARFAAGMVPGLGPFVADTVDMAGQEPLRATGRAASTLLTGGALKSGRALRNPARGKALAQEAKTLVTQALDPRKERWKADTARIAEDVARRGVRGSRQQVIEQAQAGLDTTGKKIGEYWEPRAESPLQTGPIMGELERSKQAYQNVIKDDAGNPVKVLDTEPAAVAKLGELQQMVADYGDTISAKNARGLMEAWTEPVAAGGGYSHRTPSAGFGVDLATATDLWAKREGADAIRQVLSEAHPDLRQLNREYTFQRRLRDVTEATERRTAGHRSTSLGARAAQAGGTAAGSVIGTSLGGPLIGATGAVIGGEAAKRLAMVFDGPRWKLYSAQRKMKLADAIASGDAGRIRSAVGQMIAFEQTLSPGWRPMPSHDPTGEPDR